MIDMPSNWKNIILRDICDSVQYGYTASSSKDEIGPRFLRITDIVPNVVDWSTVPYCEIEKEKIDKYLLKKYDIVIARTGATTGYAKQIRENRYAIFASYLVRLQLNNSVNKKFIGYIVQSREYKNFIKANAGGAAQPNANARILTSYPMQIPPLEIQDKIAYILSCYDNLLETNLRRIKFLEEIAQNVYNEWFVHWRHLRKKKAEIVQTPYGPRPKGWKYQPIGEIITALGGGTPSTKKSQYWEQGNINWYTPSDLTSNDSMFITESSRKITKKGLEKSSAKLFPPYSVMMTSRATLGVVSINTEEACTNQGFITCIPNNLLPVYYLYFWIKNNVERITSLASGATFKEINKTTFRKIPLLLPDAETMTKFMNLISPVGSLIEILQKKKKILGESKDLLLPKLISGEIDPSRINVNIFGE